MNYAEAAYVAASEIPVIDMAPLVDGSDVPGVAARMLGAVTGIGFFYVKNHPIPGPVIERARAAAVRFFSLPEEVKARVAINRYHRGFLGMGDSRMPGNRRTDYKESFVWGLESTPEEPAPGKANPFRTPNLWPQSMPELHRDLSPFLEHAQICAIHLMQAFAVGLGASREAFLGSSSRPISRASIVHYPPQPAELGDQQFGVGAHTDFGCLTVLCQDEVGGLQVLNAAGEWVTAHPIAGTLVVNVGDLMARWSNDRFRSTPHRVVNASGQHRYSLVAAYDPDAASLVDPKDLLPAGESPHYAPVTCGAYITERFDKSFAYRQ